MGGDDCKGWKGQRVSPQHCLTSDQPILFPVSLRNTSRLKTLSNRLLVAKELLKVVLYNHAGTAIAYRTQLYQRLHFKTLLHTSD